MNRANKALPAWRTGACGLRLLLLAAAVSGATHAWALDLRQAYGAAVEHDAAIRASRAAAEAAREKLPQAKSQRLPNVSFSATRNKNNLDSETQLTNQQTRSEYLRYFSGSQTLTLRQPLYRPYVAALVRQGEAQVESADAGLEQDEQQLLIRLAESYFDALLAQDQVTLIEAQRQSYMTQLEAAKRLLQAGSGVRTDVDEAQARVDMTEAQALEARQNVDFTRQRLASMVGMPPGDLAGLDVARFQALVQNGQGLDQWVARAEAASPELRNLRAQVEVAEQEIAKARSGHLPTLDAIAQWSKTNSDTVTSVNSRYDNKTVGLQLSVPIYAGGYVNSTVREATATHTRAVEALEATRRDLGVRVYREYRGVTEGAAKVAALEQAVRSAEQAVISNRRSFEAGSRTTVDVLNAEGQKTMALRDLAQARYMYLLSQLRLRALAGEDREVNVTSANAALLRPTP